MLIGALEDKYALPTLLTYLKIARSSYFYQKSVMKRQISTPAYVSESKNFSTKTEIAMDIAESIWLSKKTE